jgi:hypothetical protein
MNNTPSQPDHATTDFAIADFATTEYKEVCQNIRESWSYTTTLLRQYLIIQILLLSLVGLGNSAITTAGTIFTGTAQSKPASQPSATPTETTVSIEEYTLGREAKIKRWTRYGTIFALMAIGFSFSFGARLQSGRIFLNSTNFVKRAAALESKYGVGNLSLSDGKEVASLHVYMLSRLLNEQPQIKMEKVLSYVYGSGMVLWGIIAILFIIPLSGL